MKVAEGLMCNHYEITAATEDDIDDILELQERNLPHRGGTLSARFTREWFEVAIRAMPVIVARGTGLLGYLVSSPIDAYGEVPVVQAMLRTYGGSADAYIYGPICVAHDARGQGIARSMLAALRKQLPGREGILFIRCDNEASLRAHAKMGINEVTTFEMNGTRFAVLSYIG